MTALVKLSTAAILLHLAGHDPSENYALAICRATEYPSGTVVPALTRMAQRDGWLTRNEEPTTTGRARILHALTDTGRAVVNDILTEFTPRIGMLRSVEAPPLQKLAKVNTSTIWLLAAAIRAGGTTYGYTDQMRPLTHQAAYAELQRITDIGWFERADEAHVLTPLGGAAAATLGQRWGAVIDAVNR